MIIVDTNVVSELMKPSPSPVVRDWVLAQPDHELYTTSITFAEIRCGIERLADGRRRELLRTAAEEVFGRFVDYVLPFDATAAVQFALVASQRDRAGVPIDGFDAQIAAICRAHGSTLATRNVKDFQSTGIVVINPWQSS